jgi:hypothetical protein
MKTCLNACETMRVDARRIEPAYRDKQLAPQEPVPRVFGVISEVGIEKQWPLVTTNLSFTTAQFLFHTIGREARSVYVFCHLRAYCPVHSGRTEQSPRSLVMEAAGRLGLAINGGVERLSLRHNPIDDYALESFRIVGSGCVDSLLNLWGRVGERCSDLGGFNLRAP